MKILVTGGAGFIGSHIVDQYIRDGHHVISVDNLRTGKIENVNKLAEFHKLDICQQELVDVIARERPAIVNHHAAQMDVGYSAKNPMEDAYINVLGTINVLQACADNNVKRFIFASSGGTVYGENTSPRESFETDKLNPLSPYGVAKTSCEFYIKSYAQRFNLPYTILRYANVFGPRQNPHGEAGVISIFIKKLLNNEQPTINGDGKYIRDYIYIDDVVAVNKLITDRNMQGVYNVGTGHGFDVNEIYDFIHTAIKNHRRINIKPKRGEARAGDLRKNILYCFNLKVQAKWGPTTFILDGINKTVESML